MHGSSKRNRKWYSLHLCGYLFYLSFLTYIQWYTGIHTEMYTQRNEYMILSSIPFSSPIWLLFIHVQPLKPPWLHIVSCMKVCMSFMERRKNFRQFIWPSRSLYVASTLPWLSHLFLRIFREFLRISHHDSYHLQH